MGLQNRGGVNNVKESDFLSFLSNKASFLPMCVRLKPHFFAHAWAKKLVEINSTNK